MPVITADYIYSPEALLRNYCLETTPEGEVISLRPISVEDHPMVCKGILLPGFVNAHCHLELSALKGHIPRQTGMTAFIGQVISKRNDFTEETQIQAVEDALRFLWQSGTIAVGDICNTGISILPKKASPLFTYSFIELLGLGDTRAPEILNNGLALSEKFAGLAHSLSPHAPYSMSRALIRAIYGQNPQLMSIHLLESKEERQLFAENGGPFREFYQKMGIPFAGFEAKDPIAHVLSEVKKSQPMLLVHNTQMTEQELIAIAQNYPQAWFCLCPGSNLYIHNSFPDLDMFRDNTDRICLGTDSYASNASIDVFEEVKLIQEKCPEISLHEVLRWATTHGAAALGKSGVLGAFIPGTCPGVNLIEGIAETQAELLPGAVVKKLY
ncbi:MAG: amidohydrolase family protein [Bacteroidia bacterium]